MSYGEKHFEQFKLPLTWAVLGIVGAVCIVAALLFLGDRRDPDADAYAGRSGFDSVASVPNRAMAVPVHAVGDGTSWLGDYVFAASENRKLRKQISELSQFKDKYIEERDVNRRYEELLKLRTEPAVESVTARSILVSRGPFARNRLIDAGASKKIAYGFPVVTEHGLAGRIVGVSPDVSRVLMITDLTSHVPVMILRTDARAMLDGDGGDYPKLSWVRGHNSVKQGDQVLTSGDGGIFPRGLPVGEAVKGVDGIWRVKLYANRAPVDFVKVLLFRDFSQLPNADALLRSPQPSAVLPPPPTLTVTAATSTSSAASPVQASASAASPAVTRTSTSAGGSAASKTGVPKAAPAMTPSAKAKPKPLASSSAAAPELRPFVPAATASSSQAQQ